MQDYRVDLEAYSGPLDLLLFLVKRHEIDLRDIPIAELTEQYLEHLKLIKQIDMDLAGEFLVMAATLLEIKSQLLTPRSSEQGGDAGALAAPDATTDRADPRYELVQQLLAYKRFKDAATALDDRFHEWEARFPRRPGRSGAPEFLRGAGPSPGGHFVDAAGGPSGSASASNAGADFSDDVAGNVGGDDGGDSGVEVDLEDASVLDLCEAFARILQTIGQGPARHEVVYDDTPIGLHADDIVDRLRREGAMTLQSIFVGRSSRTQMIGLFLATLELVRQRRIRVLQAEVTGEIALQLIPPVSAEEQKSQEKPPDWRDPQTGQVQYDWPDEDARKRAERRARLRAKWAEKGGKPPTTEEVEAAIEDELDTDEAETTNGAVNNHDPDKGSQPSTGD